MKEKALFNFKKVLIGRLLGLMFIVFIQNNQRVPFRFLMWEFGMSRIILLPFIMPVGVGIGLITGFMMGALKIEVPHFTEVKGI